GAPAGSSDPVRGPGGAPGRCAGAAGRMSRSARPAGRPGPYGTSRRPRRRRAGARAARVGAPGHRTEGRPTPHGKPWKPVGDMGALRSGQADLFDGHRVGAAWDEVFDQAGDVRPAYRHVHDALVQMSAVELRARAETLARMYVTQGVTFDLGAAGTRGRGPRDRPPRSRHGRRPGPGTAPRGGRAARVPRARQVRRRRWSRRRVSGPSWDHGAVCPGRARPVSPDPEHRSRPFCPRSPAQP
ncbi:MAG: hypothetical protein JWP95_2370, partial [Actinotalea sp.]|nr:hypothetical protein [Actinotalea sp.]